MAPTALIAAIRRREDTAIPAKLKKQARPGLYQCNECRGQFTVTVGTVLERSKMPLNKWLLAMHLMRIEEGHSAHQLHRMLGVTYKTAWFLAHRIREAMRDMTSAWAALANRGGGRNLLRTKDVFASAPSGASRARPEARRRGPGRARRRSARSIRHATPMSCAIVQYATSTARGRLHHRRAKLYTRSAGVRGPRDRQALPGEYVRGDRSTNRSRTILSVFKRGMKGVYQHATRSTCTATSRNSTSATTTARPRDSPTPNALRIARGTEGKRLLYRPPHWA